VCVCVCATWKLNPKQLHMIPLNYNHWYSSALEQVFDNILLYLHPWLFSAAHLSRDLRSFEIRLEFESDDSDSIQRWRADSKLWHLPSYNKPRSLFNKKLQPLHRCNWDLFYVYDFYIIVARAYTLASTVGAIVQYCLRNQENLHISVHL